jgi:cation:H+ antiporter
MSEGVRGGTINAVASSMPEILTAMIALLVFSETDGFSVGIGTTAGSALFNGMLIPAVCIFAVVGTVIKGQKVNAIRVLPKVILRDGLSLIFCELCLVLILTGTTLYWWHGAILVFLYLAYFAYMITSMKSDPSPNGADEDEDEDDDEERSGVANFFYWISLGPLLDLESFFVKEKQKQKMADETWNGWPLLLTATAAIGVSCWMLVHACEYLGRGEYTAFGHSMQGLGMPTMFVAVIFASMATSVPDTILSVKDARSGDYDDAVANALGSNIFDICFALGLPLLLFTIFNGPITMTAEVADQSAELRLLLLFFTIISFLVYFLGKRHSDADGNKTIEMGRGKATALVFLYLMFTLHIIGLCTGNDVSASISESLKGLTQCINM